MEEPGSLSLGAQTSDTEGGPGLDIPHVGASRALLFIMREARSHVLSTPL